MFPSRINDFDFRYKYLNCKGPIFSTLYHRQVQEFQILLRQHLEAKGVALAGVTVRERRSVVYSFEGFRIRFLYISREEYDFRVEKLRLKYPAVFGHFQYGYALVQYVDAKDLRYYTDLRETLRTLLAVPEPLLAQNIVLSEEVLKRETHQLVRDYFEFDSRKFRFAYLEISVDAETLFLVLQIDAKKDPKLTLRFNDYANGFAPLLFQPFYYKGSHILAQDEKLLESTLLKQQPRHVSLQETQPAHQFETQGLFGNHPPTPIRYTGDSPAPTRYTQRG